MADESKVPSFAGANRGDPSMQESPGTSGLLRRLASQGGGQGGQGGNEKQSAELLMGGAQMLMQAAQINPNLLPFVQRAVEALKTGVQAMASGQGGGPPQMPKGKSPKRSPKKDSGGAGDDASMGAMGGEM